MTTRSSEIARVFDIGFPENPRTGSGACFLFDVGVANRLAGVTQLVAGTDVYGRAFEHFLIEEIRA